MSAFQSGRLFARITHSTNGWLRPSGPEWKREAAGSYSVDHGFGHEEWLFRNEWNIDGWRYGFIKGFNKGGRAYEGRSLDVSLFAKEPDKRSRLVATIYELEALDEDQSKDALEVFRRNGWLDTMKDEIAAVDGNVAAFGDPKLAKHVINVRFRLGNVERHPSNTLLPDTTWFRNRQRYLLYAFDEQVREFVEATVRRRRGSTDGPTVRRLFRRGTKPVSYEPEHCKIQTKLQAELQNEYGPNCVFLEQDYVDVRVETEDELIFFEIKSDLDPRTVIRQALGQILEYAYHPIRPDRQPNKLVIVGRKALADADSDYLNKLRDDFGLPLDYRFVEI